MLSLHSRSFVASEAHFVPYWVMPIADVGAGRARPKLRKHQSQRERKSTTAYVEYEHHRSRE